MQNQTSPDKSAPTGLSAVLATVLCIVAITAGVQTVRNNTIRASAPANAQLQLKQNQIALSQNGQEPTDFEEEKEDSTGTCTVNPPITAPTAIDSEEKSPQKSAPPLSQVKRAPVLNLRITSPYGYRVHPVTHQRAFHNGTDYAAVLNQRVFSVLDGVVTKCGPRGGLGIAVEIYHPSRRTSTIYGHLNEELVYQGQKVRSGQLIGLAGTTGMSTGVHVHFTVKQNCQYVEPLHFLSTLPQYMALYMPNEPVSVARAIAMRGAPNTTTIASANVPRSTPAISNPSRQLKPVIKTNLIAKLSVTKSLNASTKSENHRHDSNFVIASAVSLAYKTGEKATIGPGGAESKRAAIVTVHPTKIAVITPAGTPKRTTALSIAHAASHGSAKYVAMAGRANSKVHLSFNGAKNRHDRTLSGSPVRLAAVPKSKTYKGKSINSIIASAKNGRNSQSKAIAIAKAIPLLKKQELNQKKYTVRPSIVANKLKQQISDAAPLSRRSDGPRLAAEIAAQLAKTKAALHEAEKRADVAEALFNQGAISASDAKRSQAETESLRQKLNSLQYSATN